MLTAPAAADKHDTPTGANRARNSHGLTLFGTLLIAAIFAIAALLIAAQRANDLAQGMRDAENLAQVLAEQTARSIQPIDMTLREVQARLTTALVQRPEDADAPRSRALFDLIVERVKSLPQVDAFMLVDAGGRVVNISRETPAVPVDVSRRDYFQYFSSHDDHTLYVSVPVTTYLTNQPTVFLARRLNDPNGRFAGVVLAAVTLASLEDFYRAVTPAGGAITLLRRDGMLLVHYPMLEDKIGQKLPTETLWYQAVEAGGGSYSTVGLLDPVAKLVTVRPLRGFALVVDVSTTQSAALSMWWRQALRMLAAAAFVSVCLVVLLRGFTRQFSRLAGQIAELETGRQYFEAVLNNMSQGLTLFDANEKLLVYNQRYAEIYHLPADKIQLGLTLADIVKHKLASGSLPDMTVADYLARRRGLTQAGKSFDITDEFPDGRVVAMHYQRLPAGGWVVTHEEITERRRSEMALAFMARHDQLTKLPNRRLLLERLAEAIALTRRGGHCALLCLDLDRFKSINDTLGHAVGDSLLRAVAVRLCNVARDGDTVARLGGDEFAVVLTSLKSPEHAASLAERIILAFADPFEIEGHQIIASTSIGVSIAPKDGTLPDLLATNADIALYLAKAEGGGTYRFFEPEIDSYIQRRRAIERDLRAALPAEDFVLQYQPILDLTTGGVTGFEALIRWQHPIRGLLDPAEFIAVAEATGLIVPIGAWVLQQACQEAAGWPDHIDIAVNLSPVQFKRGQLVELVQAALDASGLAPHRLELEVTEAVLLDNTDDRLAVLQRLRTIGVRIVLDDFGTGYASLSQLRAFPFGRIKLDGSLLRQLDTSAGSAACLGAIIGLARSLGMTTTAKAVETSKQLETLRDHGCTQVQGYLLSRPRPPGEALSLIRHLRVPGTGSAMDALREAFDHAPFLPVTDGLLAPLHEPVN